MSDQIVDTKEPKSDTRSLKTDTEGRAVPPWQGGRNCCDGLKFDYVWLSAKWEVLFPILSNLQYLNTWFCVQALCRIIKKKLCRSDRKWHTTNLPNSLFKPVILVENSQIFILFIFLQLVKKDCWSNVFLLYSILLYLTRLTPTFSLK